MIHGVLFVLPVPLDRLRLMLCVVNKVLLVLAVTPLLVNRIMEPLATALYPV